MKYYSFIMILGFCLMLTACGPDTFYIPIDNKLGSAKPLSKTEDTIRVVVPERITKYVAKARSNDSDWEKNAIAALYISMAKVKTDDALQEQGYKLVGAGVKGGGGGGTKCDYYG